MEMAGKGRPRTGGRAKGTPNKLTADVKAMVLEALEKKGGVQYLVDQAGTNPTAFMTLLGKVLPMTVAGDPQNPLGVVTRIELVSMRDGRQD
jgi:hypothetical protein